MIQTTRNENLFEGRNHPSVFRRKQAKKETSLKEIGEAAAVGKTGSSLKNNRDRPEGQKGEK